MSIDKKDLIVTLADANFVNQAKQLFASVYFKAGWAGDYLLLASDIPETDLNWFKERGILIYKCPLLFNAPVGDLAHSPVVLSKFYLFQEYFKQWRKVIFLDADIIVQSSLDNLLQFTGFNAAVAITLKLEDEFVSRQKLSLEFKKKYKLQGPSFSTGVFVFDTDLITSDTFTKMLSLYDRFNNLIRFNEESILNLYFYKKWHKLPMVYNATPWYMESVYGLNTNKFTAAIVHFNCYVVKPWDEESLYYQEWLDNFKRADQINLINRPQAAYNLSTSYLKNYQYFLRFKRIVCWLKIDRQLGKLGLLINKISPKLYRLINLKNHDLGK